MCKILFVGSNPSQKAGKTVAFWHDARSTKILNKWTSRLDGSQIESISFANVSNAVTPGNRPLTSSEIQVASPRLKADIDKMQPTKIIALGKTAEKALTLLGLQFYAMPHPSGLNRLLNDPAYVEEKINGLKNYINPPKD